MFRTLNVHLQEFLVSLPHVVLCPRCCGCGPAELVCSHVHCLSASIHQVGTFSLLIYMMHGHTYIKFTNKDVNFT
jgi:hypothetical protein